MRANFLNQIVATKRQLLNSHEQYGRRNIAICVIATYASIFLLVKFNGKLKAKKLEKEKVTLKHSAIKDALARAGLLQ